MICPCGCQREVPNGRYWFSDECRRRGNKVGVLMPTKRSALERKLHRGRTKYEAKERVRYGRPCSAETRKRISEAKKEGFRRRRTGE